MILAGGTSRRMGRDKARALLAGRPLMCWVAEALQLLGRLIVVTNDPGAHRLPSAAAAQYVRDAHPGAGPLAGIHAALLALGPDEACIVVATCDMPFILPELVLALAQRVVAHGDDRDAPLACVWRDVSGRVQHFPAAFHKHALPLVERGLTLEDRSVRTLLASLRTATVDIGSIVDSGGLRAKAASFNVNTPSDLKEAERMAQGG